jgi:large subunit ribosomal protein L9
MQVEVLLKNKIEGLGVEADVVTVRPGYARNFLVPHGHAVLATSATKRQIEQLRQKRAQREAAELNAAQELAGKINKLKLTFTLTAGQNQDKVFGSVTSQDIADRLKQEGFTIERKQIKLDKAVKETGDHEVLISLHSDITAKLKIAIAVPAPTAPVKEDEDEDDDTHVRRPARKGKK